MYKKGKGGREKLPNGICEQGRGKDKYLTNPESKGISISLSSFLLYSYKLMTPERRTREIVFIFPMLTAVEGIYYFIFIYIII